MSSVCLRSGYSIYFLNPVVESRRGACVGLETLAMETILLWLCELELPQTHRLNDFGPHDLDFFPGGRGEQSFLLFQSV